MERGSNISPIPIAAPGSSCRGAFQAQKHSGSESISEFHLQATPTIDKHRSFTKPPIHGRAQQIT